MEKVGPRDVVIVSPLTAHSFALCSGLRTRIDPTPGESLGFAPKFNDSRFYRILYRISDEKLASLTAGAEHVFLVAVQGPWEPGLGLGLALQLRALGFTVTSNVDYQGTSLIEWEPPAG
jgi:hypothetical protein